MTRFLGKTTLVVTLIFLLSCSSDDDIPTECQELSDNIKELERQMDAATGTRKIDYEKFIAVEKNILEICIKSHQ